MVKLLAALGEPSGEDARPRLPVVHLRRRGQDHGVLVVTA
jgi:hypothetical protein